MFSCTTDSTFTVPILYKLYYPQLNCTCNDFTEAANTCSPAQEHSTFAVQILYKLYSLQLNCTYNNYTQAAATCSAAQQHTNCQLISSEVNCRRLFEIITHTCPAIRSFRLTLLAASAVAHFDSDKKQVNVTKVTDKLCKLKPNSDNFILKWRFAWTFSEP